MYVQTLNRVTIQTNKTFYYKYYRNLYYCLFYVFIELFEKIFWNLALTDKLFKEFYIDSDHN